MLAKLEELLPTIFQYFGWGGGVDGGRIKV